LTELNVNVIKNWQLASVYYAHVHTLADCVIKKHAVERLSEIFKASEGETQVG
jgi:hypothetical protein